MKFDIRAAVIVAGLGVAGASAQPAANGIDAHLAAAKAAAGFDFTGTLARICVAPQTGPGADVAPGPPPDRATGALAFVRFARASWAVELPSIRFWSAWV